MPTDNMRPSPLKRASKIDTRAPQLHYINA